MSIKKSNAVEMVWCQEYERPSFKVKGETYKVTQGFCDVDEMLQFLSDEKAACPKGKCTVVKMTIKRGLNTKKGLRDLIEITTFVGNPKEDKE